MSLAVAALRIITTKTLDGATTAAGRVFDSNVDPRDLLGEEAVPTIVIYADKGVRKISGRDLLGASHCAWLTIELFVARATLINVPAAEGQDAHEAFEIEYPATDAGLENRLRRLAYEIETTLTGSLGLWPELWRACVPHFSDEGAEWDRGADDSKGRRFNFLRLQYPVELIADPVRGAAPASMDFWARMIDAMKSDPELADLGRDWSALISTPDLPAWRRALAAEGLTYSELRAIGLAPLFDHQPTDTGDAAEFSASTLDPDAIEIDVEVS